MDSITYALIALITIQLAVLFYLMVSLKKEQIKKSARELLKAGIVFLIITLLGSVLVAIFKKPIIFLGGNFLAILLSLIFVIRFRKFHTIEIEEAELLEVERLNEQKKLLSKPAEEYARLGQVFKIGQVLLDKTVQIVQTEEEPLKSITEFINQTIKSELNADGAVLMLLDDFEDIIKVHAYAGLFPPPYQLPEDVPAKRDRVETNFKYAEFPLKGNFFADCVASGKSIFIDDPSTHSAIITNGKEDFLQHGPLLFSPLIYDAKVIGLAGVARRPGSNIFNKFSNNIMQMLCGYGATILNLAKTLKEHKEQGNIENTKLMTNHIQKTLLPKVLKKVGNLDIGVYFKQSHGVCSDYYDVIQNQKDRIFVIVADIAGKSVQSSIIMSMIRALLYLVTNTKQSTEAILDWLNKGITGKIEIDHFASLSLLTYFPDKDEAEFIGAGNQSMLIWRKKTKKIEVYEHKTDPIGVDVNSVYHSTKIAVNKDDIIAVYTDGIVETLNAEGLQYGVKSLAQVITNNNELAPREIAAKIKDNIEVFMGKTLAHDDQTILIIKPKNR